MSALTIEFDVGEFKTVRNAHRQKSLLKNREDYQRVLEKRESMVGRKQKAVPISYRLARPRKAVRVVTRSLVSQGELHGACDMPSISIGHIYFHKPSTSRACVSAEPCCKLKQHLDEDEVSSDVETEVPDDASEKNSPTLSFQSSPTLSFLGDSIPAFTLEEAGLVLEDYPAEKLPTPMSQGAASEVCDLQLPHQSQLSESNEVTALAGITRSDPPTAPPPTQRESILQAVVAKLRHQAEEAEQKAEMAQAQAKAAIEARQDAEKAAEEANAGAREVELQEKFRRQRAESAAKKEVLHMERRRAAQHRKERNQLAQQQAVKDHVYLTLQEANAIREQAQIEASLLWTQAFTEADRAAKEYVEKKLLDAKVEAEALKQDMVNHVEKTKAQAEFEAQTLKVQAGLEKAEAEEVKAKAQALHAEAARIALEKRQSVIKDVTALKARVFEQMRQKVEAAQMAQEEAEKRAQVDKKQAAVEAASQALKAAKAMEQKRSLKARKEAEKEKLLEQTKCKELEVIRAHAEEEARVIKEKTLADIAELKVKAESDAQAVRSRIIAEARKEAEAEAAALRAEAEIVVANIKSEAAKHAREPMASMHPSPEDGQDGVPQIFDLASSDLEGDWHVMSEYDGGDWDIIDQQWL